MSMDEWKIRVRAPDSKIVPLKLKLNQVVPKSKNQKIKKITVTEKGVFLHLDAGKTRLDPESALTQPVAVALSTLISTNYAHARFGDDGSYLEILFDGWGAHQILAFIDSSSTLRTNWNSMARDITVVGYESPTLDKNRRLGNSSGTARAFDEIAKAIKIVMGTLADAPCGSSGQLIGKVSQLDANMSIFVRPLTQLPQEAKERVIGGGFIDINKLLPYQFSDLAMMLDLEKDETTRGGILAEEMGMGKTLIMLALICHGVNNQHQCGLRPVDRTFQEDLRDFMNWSGNTFPLDRNYEARGLGVLFDCEATLYITNQAILADIEAETVKWTTLEAVVWKSHLLQLQQDDLVDLNDTIKERFEKVGSKTIIIVAKESFAQFVASHQLTWKNRGLDCVFRYVRFKRVIYDEFQDFSNHKVSLENTVNAHYTWIMSGTPFTHTKDLPFVLSALKHPFAEAFKLAEPGSHLESFEAILKPLTIRTFSHQPLSYQKLRALNVKVRLHVPIRLPHHIKHFQARNSNEELDGSDEEELDGNPELSVLLTQAQRDLYRELLEEEPAPAGRFCRLRDLIHVSINAPDLKYPNAEGVTEKHVILAQKLQDILSKQERAIVFHYDDKIYTCDKLKDSLEYLGIPCNVGKDSVRGVAELRAALGPNSDFVHEKAIWILNLKTFASGLNLQGANHVIFLTPYTELHRCFQAMARILRPNQQFTVNFWWFCSDSPTEYWSLYRCIMHLADEFEPARPKERPRPQNSDNEDPDENPVTFQDLWNLSTAAVKWDDERNPPASVLAQNWSWMEDFRRENNWVVVENVKIPKKIQDKARKSISGTFQYSGRKVNGELLYGVYQRPGEAWAVYVFQSQLSVSKITERNCDSKTVVYGKWYSNSALRTLSMPTLPKDTKKRKTNKEKVKVVPSSSEESNLPKLLIEDPKVVLRRLLEVIRNLCHLDNAEVLELRDKRILEYKTLEFLHDMTLAYRRILDERRPLVVYVGACNNYISRHTSHCNNDSMAVFNEMWILGCVRTSVASNAAEVVKVVETSLIDLARRHFENQEDKLWNANEVADGELERLRQQLGGSQEDIVKFCLENGLTVPRNIQKRSNYVTHSQSDTYYVYVLLRTQADMVVTKPKTVSRHPNRISR